MSERGVVDGARDATLDAMMQCNARCRVDALKIAITQGFFRCHRAVDRARQVLFARCERSTKPNATNR